MKTSLAVAITIAVLFGCSQKEPNIREYVHVTATQRDNGHVSVQPNIRPESSIYPYERRFLYLLYNVPQKDLYRKYRNLYPDTARIESLFLDELAKDPQFTGYFHQSLRPIISSPSASVPVYSVEELMDVASKFFYCDKVNPDTTIQAHVCVGLNGVKEASWSKDFTVLAAFCFEAIFHYVMDSEESAIWDTFGKHKLEASQLHVGHISSLDDYLQRVRLEVFDRMKKEQLLRDNLLTYYQTTKETLAFRIAMEIR